MAYRFGCILFGPSHADPPDPSYGCMWAQTVG